MKTKQTNFIDFERINLLLEGFNKATGFVTAILDLNGNILSQSGWRTICTDFHRVHPETHAKCNESDTFLSGQLGSGQKYNCYKCLNGLIDVAVPLIINGEHVANLFSGQFFYEKPSQDFFIRQAKKYNFNKKDYLVALDNVPVVSEEKVKIVMDFLLDMTLLISQITQQRIKLIQTNKELSKHRDHLEELVKERTNELETKNKELEKFNKLFIDREFRIKELRDKVGDMEKRLGI